MYVFCNTVINKDFLLVCYHINSLQSLVLPCLGKSARGEPGDVSKPGSYFSKKASIFFGCWQFPFAGTGGLNKNPCASSQ